MIISCPSCQTQFKVDETRLAVDGTKVRCSKCGHVWRTMPDGQPTASAGQPMPAMTSAGRTPERVEPVLSARDDIGGEDADGDSAHKEFAEESSEAMSPEHGMTAAAGLTGEQRAKLKAAGKKKQPGGAGFWIKVLLVFIVVLGILLVAHKMGMLPKPDLKKAGLAVEQPAEVGEVDAKPVPADPANSGHIIGGEEPAKPAE